MDPHKTFDEWHAFALPNINLALYLLEEGEMGGINCVHVFEFKESEVDTWIESGRDAGATLTFDELEYPDIINFLR